MPSVHPTIVVLTLLVVVVSLNQLQIQRNASRLVRDREFSDRRHHTNSTSNSSNSSNSNDSTNKSTNNSNNNNASTSSTSFEEHTIFARPTDFPDTPNFYQILESKQCLPNKRCLTCLGGKKKYVDCHVCRKQCGCYCRALCGSDNPQPKFVSKQVSIRTTHSTQPQQQQQRLIPRIVHQTWFEEVAPETYPNMSRLVQSFRQSGWEYRFYTDDESRTFLDQHFPREVREAYDMLIPGAYKADLFRYCVLLIHGGVYADVDVLLESNLDVAIQPDVGFMVPFDGVSI
jgi:hypothetical protein